MEEGGVHDGGERDGTEEGMKRVLSEGQGEIRTHTAVHGRPSLPSRDVAKPDVALQYLLLLHLVLSFIVFLLLLPLLLELFFFPPSSCFFFLCATSLIFLTITLLLFRLLLVSPIL